MNVVFKFELIVYCIIIYIYDLNIFFIDKIGKMGYISIFLDYFVFNEKVYNVGYSVWKCDCIVK